MPVFNKAFLRSRYILTAFTLFLLTINILFIPSCTEQITSENQDTLNLEAAPPVENKLVAVGDVMLSRTVGEKIREMDDPRAPFLNMAGILEDADLTFCNLENPFYDEAPQNEGKMIFGADPVTVEGLKYTGFDIVSLANNHFGDQGTAAMKFTFYHLNENGIEYTGAGENEVTAREPVIIERNGVKFAFLGYNDVKSALQNYAATADKPGTATLTRENLIQDIKYAKARAHVVVVSIHWGVEYEKVPTERQTMFARLAIDSGASLVLGHHPHVIQPVEKYKDGYIFYSLGNFVFDQMWSEETRIGMIASIFFQGVEIERVNTTEVTIYDSYQPALSDSSPVYSYKTGD